MGSAPARRAPARQPKTAVRESSEMRLVAGVAAAVFVLDQALKYLVVHVLQLDMKREIDVLPPWLNLRMAWNQGVNFGLMSSDQDVMRWVLIGIALAICLWVGIWVWRAKLGRFARIAAGMLIGGALGNVVDRVLYGAVADFLNMSLPGWQNPYSFNVADIAIFAGAIGLVLTPQNKPEAKPTPRKPAARPRVEPPKPAVPRPPKQGDLFRDVPRPEARDDTRQDLGDGGGKSG
ncbi:signal peptidase II [Paracoccus sp. (in: a-proteobacteria)]|uniref:signal peptidase II n=1 Tax=Paracoccus sp. TaxID=267 RepID=UPI00396C2EDA